MASTDTEIQLQNPNPMASTPKAPKTDLPPLRKPEVDPGITLILPHTGTYTEMYDKLRPQIAWLLQYMRFNKGAVAQAHRDEFDVLFNQWLAGVEKKKAGGMLKELLTQQGHREVVALWDKFIAVRRKLEEDVNAANPSATATTTATTAAAPAVTASTAT